MGGWVGGWGYLAGEDVLGVEVEELEELTPGLGLGAACGRRVGGWVGGWVVR